MKELVTLLREQLGHSSGGPAAVPNALPDDPLYRNDKTICEGVLGLAGE